MAKQFNDFGLGNRVRQLVNKDGTFNIRRVGLRLSTVNLYQTLVRMTWVKFLSLITVILFMINAAFAVFYFVIGVENFDGMMHQSPYENFLQCFFFSFQTFTTVGYGHIAPRGDLISLLAAFEAMTGLMIFAIITGLLYGRFARPSARILYSENMLVAPYNENGKSLQFRIVNKRKSMIMELTARMLLSYQEKDHARKYLTLELERSFVTLFPLNWTIVHPITETSPLYKIDHRFLVERDAEFIIVIKGYDDTFSQEVHSVYSYRYDEIIWGAKFDPMYFTDEDNTVVLDFSRLNSYTQVDIGMK